MPVEGVGLASRHRDADDQKLARIGELGARKPVVWTPGKHLYLRITLRDELQEMLNAHASFLRGGGSRARAAPASPDARAYTLRPMTPRAAPIDSTADLASQAAAHGARLREASERLKEESKEAAGVAAHVEKLGELAGRGDLVKLKAELGKLRSSLADDGESRLQLRDFLNALDAEVASAPRRLREELTRSLGEACEARGLVLRPISLEDPIEVRIAPLSVLLELDKGQATFRFGRDAVGACAARADEIVDTHQKLAAELDGAFDAERFFDQCRRAYLAGIGAEGKKDGDRLELTAFLPHLALQRQGKAFFSAPNAKNFRPYSKAQLAYDVWKLGQVAGFEKGGLRLCFGVATGSSASDKSRVVYFEDGDGRGEYKLTVFFVQES